LDGGLGNDSMVGGVGNDTYFIDSATDVVVEAAGAGIDWVNSSVTHTLVNTENLILTGTTAINGIGNAVANSITGNNAANTLVGNGGNDTLMGNDGNDVLRDSIGDDSLVGGNGNDNLYAGIGTDILVGGMGNDVYYLSYAAGDVANDAIKEAANAGTDTAYAVFDATLAANVENLTLLGATAINAIGNDLNNTIYGNSANNTLNGGLGNDILRDNVGDDRLVGDEGNDNLYAGSGSDTLIGGLGNDIYYLSYAAADGTNDVIIEEVSSGTDTAYAIFSATLAANVENLTLLGLVAISGTGNDLNNTIYGNSANNMLNGSGGNDYLVSGTGSDEFVFSGGPIATNIGALLGIDRIADFAVGVDKIVLSSTTFSSLPATLAASDFEIVTSNALAASSTALIVYNSANGALFYNQNGSAANYGNGGQFATLNAGLTTLSVSDFASIA
jgi:Ca2+-binding RTX toxin-like protein